MVNNNNSIERKLILKASIDQVWDALTIPEQLSQWFGQSADFSLIPGSIGSFGWESHGTFAMRIEQVQPKNLFSWRWMAQKDSLFEEKLSTLVIWKLRALTDGSTELYMIESGFLNKQSKQDNISGWQQELEHLQIFIQK